MTKEKLQTNLEIEKRKNGILLTELRRIKIQRNQYEQRLISETRKVIKLEAKLEDYEKNCNTKNG